MGGKSTEACGRCAMSTVVDVTESGKGDEGAGSSDPYGNARIEVDESELRAVSPAAWLEGVKRRLDDLAGRLTYGR